MNRTEAVTKQIDEILKTYPEVKSFISVSGFSVMGGGAIQYGHLLRDPKELERT